MKTKQTDARAALFGNRNFRWLFSGALVSQLGDQFSLIALPWLVLRMTGDTLALGAVLAVMAVPRALFMLLGGALVDRHTPVRVLMISRYASTALLAALAALTLAGRIDLPLVYALSLAIGVASAFSLPAATSMLPTVLPPALLGQANGVMMGVRQLASFAGPLLAGLLIALFGEGAGAGRDLGGIGAAFAFDAFSFALSAWTLSRVRPPARPAQLAAPRAFPPQASVWASMAEGLRYCWRDSSLRLCFCYWAAVMFFVSGPIQVAMPVLAGHVGGSASTYGLLVGAYGAGTLLGMAVSGIRPGLRIGSFGATLLTLDAAVALLFMPLGLIAAAWQGMLLLLAIGAIGGFMQVNIFTWLQRHVAGPMLGRTMALFMFIVMGIAPLSASATGWLMRGLTLPQVFASSAGLLIAIVALAAALSELRQVSDAGTAAPSGTAPAAPGSTIDQTRQ